MHHHIVGPQVSDKNLRDPVLGQSDQAASFQFLAHLQQGEFLAVVDRPSQKHPLLSVPCDILLILSLCGLGGDYPNLGSGCVLFLVERGVNPLKSQLTGVLEGFGASDEKYPAFLQRFVELPVQRCLCFVRKVDHHVPADD